MNPLFNQHSEAYIIDPLNREVVYKKKGRRPRGVFLVVLGIVERARARLAWLVDTDVTLVKPV